MCLKFHWARNVPVGSDMLSQPWTVFLEKQKFDGLRRLDSSEIFISYVTCLSRWQQLLASPCSGPNAALCIAWQHGSAAGICAWSWVSAERGCPMQWIHTPVHSANLLTTKKLKGQTTTPAFVEFCTSCETFALQMHLKIYRQTEGSYELLRNKDQCDRPPGRTLRPQSCLLWPAR